MMMKMRTMMKKETKIQLMAKMTNMKTMKMRMMMTKMVKTNRKMLQTGSAKND